MTNPAHHRNRLVLLPLVVFTLMACEREQRRLQTPPSSLDSPAGLRQSSIQPGPGASVPEGSQAGLSGPAQPEERNAYAVSQGKRLFRWYNCNGCHAQGGGDSGPPLMDEHWVYGGQPREIVASILQGRPNGMPSFAGRIPEEQAWQLAAYIRSMSGQLPIDVAPGRSDGLFPTEPEQRREPQPPEASHSPPPAR
jgi:cytochrome c oxidase cbb3-type subunit 3